MPILMAALNNAKITLEKYPPVAQLVEQLPLKQMVVGSSPSGRTNKRRGVKTLVEGLPKSICFLT